MLRRSCPLLFVFTGWFFVAFPAVAEDAVQPMPAALVIGYDDEGKVDTSEASCRAFVTDVVEWEKAETDQAVRDVCAHRTRHAEAYAALQSAYQAFRSTVEPMTRFDGAAAAKHIGALIKNCIDMKWALSTGGHNIGIDMIPNAIAADCLNLGRDLLGKETARLNGSDDPPTSGGE